MLDQLVIGFGAFALFEVLVAIVAIVVICMVMIGIYNRLISGRQEVRNAWSQIDIQLKRRHDLIPNLANVVKGALEAEKAQLAAVMAARNQAVNAATPVAAMQAENALTGALRGFMTLIESYPQLRSQQDVSVLMDELTTTENRIAFARQHYNDVVQAQNVRATSVPGIFLARRIGIEAESMFQVPEAEHAAIATAPDIRL
jgi:LemA protein